MKFFVYLKLAKKKSESIINFSTVTVVLGNETCDLDSAVCSIVYAWELSNDDKLPDENLHLVLPVLNTNREAFKCRPEVSMFLEENQITPDMLIFRDDLDLHTLHSDGKLKLVLVDHHILPEGDQVLNDSIVEILDHRPFENVGRDSDVQCLISNAGSCSTIVAWKLLKNPELINVFVAKLLYGAVLLDTVCLSSSAGRATELDFHVINSIEEMFPFHDKRIEIFQRLCDARMNCANLGPLEMLTKDLKFAGKVAMPVLPILIQDFIKNFEAIPALHKFCKEKNCFLVVLMGYLIKGDTIKRDLAVFTSHTHHFGEEILSCLKESTSPCLELHDMRANIEGLLLCNQKNAKISRKLLLPLVEKAAERYLSEAP